MRAVLIQMRSSSKRAQPTQKSHAAEVMPSELCALNHFDLSIPQRRLRSGEITNQYETWALEATFKLIYEIHRIAGDVRLVLKCRK